MRAMVISSCRLVVIVEIRAVSSSKESKNPASSIMISFVSFVISVSLRDSRLKSS